MKKNKKSLRSRIPCCKTQHTGEWIQSCNVIFGLKIHTQAVHTYADHVLFSSWILANIGFLWPPCLKSISEDSKSPTLTFHIEQGQYHLVPLSTEEGQTCTSIFFYTCFLRAYIMAMSYCLKCFWYPSNTLRTVAYLRETGILEQVKEKVQV